jgi:hypothetical protein
MRWPGRQDQPGRGGLLRAAFGSHQVATDVALIRRQPVAGSCPLNSASIIYARIREISSVYHALWALGMSGEL